MLQVGAIAKLGLVVVATFALCWAPFLSSPSSALQVLQRLIPVKRGLYEDYVANFWCVSSPVFKWRRVYSQQVALSVSSLHACGVLQEAWTSSALRHHLQQLTSEHQYNLPCGRCLRTQCLGTASKALCVYIYIQMCRYLANQCLVLALYCSTYMLQLCVLGKHTAFCMELLDMFVQLLGMHSVWFDSKCRLW